jgi:hypothetical protein
METKRKLQFGAAAVIANGLLALTAMTPRTALANPCAEKILCSCQNLAYCQSIAAPGCTATSVQTCTPEPACPPAHVGTICHYD